jgi:hypothetical protein
MGMTDLFALVHAPVLGPASWRPAAAELTAAGQPAGHGAVAGWLHGRRPALRPGAGRARRPADRAGGPPGRPRRPGRALRRRALSAGYEPAAAQARQRGWPVEELPGTHLHPLVAPAEVAAAILSLAAALP